MDNIFKNLDFWTLFILMENSIDKAEFDNQLEKLKQLFQYSKNVYSEDYEENLIEFEFNCGEVYSIILEYRLNYSVEWAESGSRLYLTDKSIKKRFLMGWNDMAQWHPLCIKPDEFDLLVSYWNTYDSKWKNTNYPKLLLRQYVGFSNKIQVDKFENELNNDFESLGFQIPEVIKPRLLGISFYEDCDYQWLKHKDLGWVYESKVYNCYSIRNECHSKSENELFPFEKYKEMINSIKFRVDS